MSYLKSLTDYLTTKVAGKEKVDVWIENDTLEFLSAYQDNGFESHQVISFVLSDVGIDANTFKMHIVNWMRTYIPDFDNMGLPYPSIHIEPLENGKFDVAGVIELKDTVTFHPNEQGDWEVNGQKMEVKSNFQEPDPLVSELVTFDGVTQDAELNH